MHQKHLLNVTIKKLIGNATADELLALENLVKAYPADAFFVTIITAWFDAGNETNEEQSKRLFKRIRDKITP